MKIFIRVLICGIAVWKSARLLRERFQLVKLDYLGEEEQYPITVHLGDDETSLFPEKRSEQHSLVGVRWPSDTPILPYIPYSIYMQMQSEEETQPKIGNSFTSLFKSTSYNINKDTPLNTCPPPTLNSVLDVLYAIPHCERRKPNSSVMAYTYSRSRGSCLRRSTVSYPQVSIEFGTGPYLLLIT